MTPSTRSESRLLSLPDAKRLWGSIAAAPGAPPAGHRPILLAILAACFVLRLGLGWFLPNIHHADEVYQVAEQANRSLHGYGIVSWEFRTSSRTVLLPALVKPIYALSASAETHRILLAALFCVFSLIPVWVAFQWVGRLYGLRGAILAATMMATWFELVYFAPKPTADAVCSYFLVAALFLARPAARSAELFLAGLSLMLAFGMRVQIAPAIGIVFLSAAMVKGGRRRTAALLGGVATGLAVVGFVEWLWWGVPFQGQWGYLAMEFLHRSSTYFGRQPVTFFAKEYVLLYGGALPLMVFLIYAGARNAPVLLLTSLAVILPFHFVGHKEYRFVVAGLPLLVLLMGLAAAELMNRFDPAIRRGVLPTVVCGWLVSMVALSFSDHYRPYWTRDGNHVLAFEEIGRDPDACGVALVGIRWWHTPGYSGLGRDIPIYELSPDQEARIMSAANYVLLAPKQPAPRDPYVRWREYSRPVQYLYRRPGGCVPDESAQIVLPPGIR